MILFTDIKTNKKQINQINMNTVAFVIFKLKENCHPQFGNRYTRVYENT